MGALRLLAVAAVALGLSPAGAAAQWAGPQQRGDTGVLRWPDVVPAGSPFEPSTAITGVTFDGPWGSYCTADTFYPSWGADGRLYSPFMDGLCYAAGSFGGFGMAGLAGVTTLGTAVIRGSDPLALDMSTGVGIKVDEAVGYDGRYASASLHHDGVWYYGSYTLNRDPQPGAPACGNYCTLGPFVGFDTSTDGGRTWRRTPHTAADPLFGESPKGGHRVKLGALHVVDFGKNMEHSPDGKMYLVGHGGGGPTSLNSWVNADEVYMVRVEPSPATVNDESAYEYYAGEDAAGEPVWSDDLADIEPLLRWPGHLGSAAAYYDAGLDRYLMWISRPTDGVNGVGTYDTMLLEAEELTGEWRMVHYLPRFGSQAYFVTTPTRFMSADGRTMWMGYSANYNNPGGAANPAGSGYSWVLRKLTLELG